VRVLCFYCGLNWIHAGRLQGEQTVLHLAVQSSTPSSIELVAYLLHAHGGRLLERSDDVVRSPFPSPFPTYPPGADDDGLLSRRVGVSLVARVLRRTPAEQLAM
jgi:hypothetical protein